MVPPTRLSRTARRAQLIEAAAKAFLERGFDGTSMDHVAQEAGVSRLIVYRIFESKHELYRAVLAEVNRALGHQFVGVDSQELLRRGAARLMLPVARSHPDAFRLLWRHARNEPDFAAEAVEFRGYVTFYAGQILRRIIDDPVLLEWAARSAAAHLVEGICTWLDVGDPARDEHFAGTITAGLRALGAAWATRAAAE